LAKEKRARVCSRPGSRGRKSVSVRGERKRPARAVLLMSKKEGGTLTACTFPEPGGKKKGSRFPWRKKGRPRYLSVVRPLWRKEKGGRIKVYHFLEKREGLHFPLISSSGGGDGESPFYCGHPAFATKDLWKKGIPPWPCGGHVNETPERVALRDPDHKETCLWRESPVLSTENSPPCLSPLGAVLF